MIFSIMTNLLSTGEEERLFTFIYDHQGIIAAGSYRSKSATYKILFNDKALFRRFSADYINYTFRRGSAKL